MISNTVTSIFLRCCRDAERERDLAERAEFEQRLREKDAQERKKRHGGKHIEEEHAALDAGMDDSSKKALIAELRTISEQAYLEKRQEKRLQVGDPCALELHVTLLSTCTGCDRFQRSCTRK